MEYGFAAYNIPAILGIYLGLVVSMARPELAALNRKQLGRGPASSTEITVTRRLVSTQGRMGASRRAAL